MRILEQLSEQEATQPQPQPQPVTSSEVGGSGGGSSKRKGRKASKPTKRIDDTQVRLFLPGRKLIVVALPNTGSFLTQGCKKRRGEE